MFDGRGIIRAAKVEYTDQLLAVGAKPPMLAPVSEGQSQGSIVQTRFVVLPGVKILARPIPNEHIQAVGMDVAGRRDGFFDEGFLLEAAEDGSGRCPAFVPRLPFVVLYQLLYCECFLSLGSLCDEEAQAGKQKKFPIHTPDDLIVGKVTTILLQKILRPPDFTLKMSDFAIIMSDFAMYFLPQSSYFCTVFRQR